MNRQRILIVEDEEAFVDALSVGLGAEGFEVIVARDGAEALIQFESSKPDLVLLDLMLPRISGLEVCRQIRRTSQVPIIMVTAKSGEIDTVVGLEIGADDYISKPYRMRELVARMRAVLRRSPEQNEHQRKGLIGSDNPVESHRAIEVGDVRLDPDRHEVTVGGEPVRLTLKEFELLEILLNNAGRVVRRETIIDRVWGYDYVGDTKTLDVHIKRLRSKIEPTPSRPRYIVTIRGLGYKFEHEV